MAATHVARDLARFNTTFHELGAVVTADDGSQWVDPSKVPTRIKCAYQRLLQHGAASGMLPYLDTGHGITWEDVRAGTLADLAEGVTFVKPSAFTAYWTHADGTVTGHGWLPLDGVAWTVQSIADGQITAVSHTGREITERIPDRPNLRFLIKR